MKLADLPKNREGDKAARVGGQTSESHHWSKVGQAVAIVNRGRGNYKSVRSNPNRDSSQQIKTEN